MIFNTLSQDGPSKQHPEFVEIRVRIPKWIMTQIIEEALRSV